MSRYLEFINLVSVLDVDQEQLKVAAAAAMSAEREIRNADKIGFATVDADVRNVDGMPFVRQNIASGTLKDGDVFLCAVRYNHTEDAIKLTTAARSLNMAPRAGEAATPSTDTTPGAPAESEEIPF